MPPRLSFSANAYKKTDFSSAVKDIAACGYSALEVYADIPHLYPLDTSIQQQEQAAATIRRAGLQVSNVNAFTMFKAGDTWRPSYIERDESRRRQRIEHTVAAMEMAHRLGSPSISTEPGGPLESGISWDDALELFVKGLDEVLERTEHLDTLLLVEPEPGLLLEMPEHIDIILDKSLHPRLSIKLDIGHFFCVGAVPEKVILDYAGSFDHIHIEDIGADRKHLHLVPGDGSIDFRAVFDALAQILYDGYVTVELYPFEDSPGTVARRAMEFLAPLWRDVFGEEPGQ